MSSGQDHVASTVPGARGRKAAAALTTGIVAAVVLWLSWENGAFDPDVRYGFTIAIWWILGLGVVLGLLPRARLTPTGIVALELMTALCVWTAASTLWAANQERAVVELNRSTMYLGVLVLVLMTTTVRDLGRIADGLAVGIAAVGIVAVVSRLFPDAFSSQAIPELLPGSEMRLSFPLGYWNGLAVLVALGIPLLVRGGLSWRSFWLRGAALAAVPPLYAVIYLSSSRGGGVAALAGVAALIALSADRWPAVCACAVGALGGAAAVYVFHSRPELVNGPLGTDLANRDSRTVGALLVLISVATGALFAVGARLLADRVTIPRPVNIAAVAIFAALAIGGLVAAEPGKRFDEFKSYPTFAAGDFVSAHLTSASGTGRWQQWGAVLDAWRDAPLGGIGAGGYRSYWIEHRPSGFPFVTNAHSLYLGTLGELGLVGFLLLVAALGALVVAGVSSTLRSFNAERSARVALLAVALAFLVAAGIDWMWELTAVGVVGLAALGAAAGGTSAAGPAGWPVRIGVGVVTLLVVGLTAALLATELELDASRADARAGNDAGALNHARAASDAAPWASSPYVQLALVREQMGDITEARAAIESAIEKDSNDWQLWLIRSRLETRGGEPVLAERSLRRASALNPQFEASP